jgi:hypothetical protein
MSFNPVILRIKSCEFTRYDLIRGDNLPTNLFWKLWRENSDTMKKRGWNVQKVAGKWIVSYKG